MLQKLSDFRQNLTLSVKISLPWPQKKGEYSECSETGDSEPFSGWDRRRSPLAQWGRERETDGDVVINGGSEKLEPQVILPHFVRIIWIERHSNVAKTAYHKTRQRSWSRRWRKRNNSSNVTNAWKCCIRRTMWWLKRELLCHSIQSSRIPVHHVLWSFQAFIRGVRSCRMCTNRGLTRCT